MFAFQGGNAHRVDRWVGRGGNEEGVPKVLAKALTGSWKSGWGTPRPAAAAHCGAVLLRGSSTAALCDVCFLCQPTVRFLSAWRALPSLPPPPPPPPTVPHWAKISHCVRTACILRTQRLGYSPKNTCHLFTRGKTERCQYHRVGQVSIDTSGCSYNQQHRRRRTVRSWCRLATIEYRRSRAFERR